MGEGFPLFLLLLFVFWVLESIAKARRRGLPTDDQPEGDRPDGEPTRLEVPPEERTTRPQPRTPRDLFEELAELARQQQQEKQRQRPGRPPPRPVPGPTAEAPPLPRPAPAPPAAGRPASKRWEGGTEREVVVRHGRPVGEERRSDRWMTGKEREAPVEIVPAAPAPRPQRREGVVRREARHLEETAVPALRAHADGRIPDLRRASPGQLRQLFVLREVLGPPLALRDEEPAEPR